MEWHNEELDLREVIDSSIASVSQVFREKDVALVAEVPEKVPTLMADRDRLIQVMLNLLSNAVKFVVPGSGRVIVRLLLHDEGLRVDVVDNGPGIGQEDQRVIFEKFRQGGDTMTDKPQGTGLGLPISKQIVEHFGGRLWVESEIGKGAMFSFTLPMMFSVGSDGVSAALAA
jgi:signal transduction histidine kinase